MKTGGTQPSIFDLKRYLRASWYDSLLADFDAFRKRFLIVSMIFGLLMPAAVAFVSIEKGEFANLIPLVLAEIALAAMLIASVGASRKAVGFISYIVLAAYPVFYLAAVLSPYSHRTYVILLIIMPSIVAVLSPQGEKLPWLIYSSAVIMFVNVVPSIGIPTAWVRDYSAKDIVVLHSATSIIAAISYLWDAQLLHYLEAQAQRILRDEDTGLPTAAALGEALKGMEGSIVCVVSIDNFYELSALFGYEFCDEILVYAASRLEATVREIGGLCFRLHGRDLGVLRAFGGEDERERKAAEYIERLYAAIRGPVDLKGKRVEILYSIGYTFCHGQNVTKALNEAGGALWRCSGRHVVCRHDENAFGAAAVELSFVRLATLSRCVREGGLEAHFQPVVSLASGKPLFCEALLRVRGDSGSLEPPALYIEVARSTGYWGAISDFMLTQAVKRIRSGGGSVSINIGLADVEREGFRRSAIEGAAVAREGGCDLILEFLETDSDVFSEEQLGFIKELRAEGCLIAIDDFGTGYSNYTRLLGFPFDIVKFDMSLARKAMSDNAVSALVGGLVRFCSGIGVITVVEGIETEAAAKYFKDMGCDFGQGYYWSKAVPAEEAPPARGTLRP
ncbi:MAG: EAL domain-containing protein [Spirochaetales bacterium]